MTRVRDAQVVCNEPPAFAVRLVRVSAGEQAVQLDDLKLAHGEITREIIGAFYDVYNALGFGFVESVYANAMVFALRSRRVRFVREQMMSVFYERNLIGEFRADFVVNEKVIVELKVAERVGAAHERQLLNYLRASGLSVGLVLNFGPKPATRRLVLRGRSPVVSNPECIGLP